MREVKKVEVLSNYELLLTFDNDEVRVKDMKPYLNKGVFQKLKEKDFFNKVKVCYGAISWGDKIDMCADNLYSTSKKIQDA